jgi:flavin-binding protein dodecin
MPEHEQAARDRHRSQPMPAVERLIDRVARRLTRLVWMHGLATAGAALAVWLAFAFIADWTLHLPAGVRWIHLALLVAIPCFFLARDLVRPLRRRPRRSGLAVLVERAHPDLEQLLVSAVELTATDKPSGDPELIDSLARAAEARAREIDLRGVFDPRGPRRRLSLAAGAFGGCALLLISNPTEARVFFKRLAGGDEPWPQRTHLSIEVPVAGGVHGAKPTGSDASEADADRAPGDMTAARRIVVRIARGSDLPVIVRAEGAVPDEVTLHFSGGHKAVLASSGGNVFRTLLRSCQENTEFFATGGDDQDDDPTVSLIVLQPPDVSGLAVEIRPPTYSGLTASTVFDRDVEVLAGSQLSVHVLVEPPQARGVVRLLPEDRVVQLVKSPFPAPSAEAAARSEPAATPAAPASAREGLGFELSADKSLRYRFELTDDTGLSNPDPGLFGVAVVEDRAPEVEILSPGRGDYDTVLGGRIALRARAEDDFGITRMSWSSVPATEGDAAAAHAQNPLELVPVPPAAAERIASTASGADVSRDGESARGDRAEGPHGLGAQVARAAAIGRRRIEVKELSSGEPVVEGQQFQLQVIASDNCEPKAHEGRSAPVRIRVVSPDEFLRRVQDRLARAQAAAGALSELQRDKSRRALDLLAVIESDQLVPEGAAAELSAALVGEKRVQGDARSLSRELAAITESVLYARIDDHAAALLEFIDQRAAQATGRGFDPAPWRDLASAYRQGTLGTAGLSGKLVDIVGLALEISEDLSTAASDALARAQDTVDLARVHAELGTATAAQKNCVAKIERLLELLSEWDNFQSVLSLTRDIMNGEKSLSERTGQFAKEH